MVLRICCSFFEIKSHTLDLCFLRDGLIRINVVQKLESLMLIYPIIGIYTLYRITNYVYGSVLCRYADRQDAYYQYQNQQYG